MKTVIVNFGAIVTGDWRDPGAVSLMRTGLSIGRVIPGLCRKLTPFGQRGGAIFFEGFAAVEMTFEIEMIVD